MAAHAGLLWRLARHHLCLQTLPLALTLVVGSLLITLHSSLQHEILHGHPTRSRRVNKVLGMIPLSLWIPFERYKQTHLLHHIDERLTDPLDDPESYYWTDEDWRRIGPVGRALVEVQTTLLGRIVGRAVLEHGAVPRREEARHLMAGAGNARRVWAEHLLFCVPVLLWISLVCGMPLWLYVLGMVVPGTAILLIRSFAEHKALPESPERTAIVENSWFLGPLFLFNNLHALHHEAPTIPWYRYPAYYRENRERLVQENGGLVYDSYLDVARRFLLSSHDKPKHPVGRVPRAGVVSALSSEFGVRHRPPDRCLRAHNPFHVRRAGSAACGAARSNRPERR